MASEQDLPFMDRALALAEQGRGRVSPNPLVGCVIVGKNRVVGEGWHRFFGGPHAEAEALQKAGSRARGATLYVNLEPCGHWGKTPPCAEAVIRAGIKRVVAAMKDPNPLVAGQGFARLRRAGIRVETGLGRETALFLNRAFVKAHTRGLPYVIWKTAQTLDGKIASARGLSRWITGPRARRLGHGLRAASDAVLVGGNTVRRDDPSLDSHGQGPDPLKLVVSRSLSLDPKARIFRKGPGPWIITGPNPLLSRQKALEKAGGKILKYPLKDGRIDIRKAFNDICKMNINQVLLEGGGNLSFAMLSAGLVDEIFLFLAPSFLGGKQAPTSLEGAGWPAPGRSPALRNADIRRVGRDFLLHGFLNRGAA